MKFLHFIFLYIIVICINNYVIIFIFQTVRPHVNDDTPNKPSVVQEDDHKLFYTDTQAFQGPMTQLIKAAFPSASDHCTEFMQVDNNSRFDYSTLPNLNAEFSELVELTPHEVSIYLQFRRVTITVDLIIF